MFASEGRALWTRTQALALLQQQEDDGVFLWQPSADGHPAVAPALAHRGKEDAPPFLRTGWTRDALTWLPSPALAMGAQSSPPSPCLAGCAPEMGRNKWELRTHPRWTTIGCRAASFLVSTPQAEPHMIWQGTPNTPHSQFRGSCQCLASAPGVAWGNNTSLGGCLVCPGLSREVSDPSWLCFPEGDSHTQICQQPSHANNETNLSQDPCPPSPPRAHKHSAASPFAPASSPQAFLAPPGAATCVCPPFTSRHPQTGCGALCSASPRAPAPPGLGARGRPARSQLPRAQGPYEGRGQPPPHRPRSSSWKARPWPPRAPSASSCCGDQEAAGPRKLTQLRLTAGEGRDGDGDGPRIFHASPAGNGTGNGDGDGNENGNGNEVAPARSWRWGWVGPNLGRFGAAAVPSPPGAAAAPGRDSDGGKVKILVGFGVWLQALIFNEVAHV